MANKYTKEILEAAAKDSHSIANVLRVLGLRQAGGTQAHISTLLKKFDVDTSHFTGKGHNKGKISKNRVTLEEVFIILPEGSNRKSRKVLKRCMIESGIPELCNACGIGPEWNEKTLTLEINHIDGNWLNNLRDNLEFLCPNCHSQDIHNSMSHKYRK